MALESADIGAVVLGVDTGNADVVRSHHRENGSAGTDDLVFERGIEQVRQQAGRHEKTAVCANAFKHVGCLDGRVILVQMDGP